MGFFTSAFKAAGSFLGLVNSNPTASQLASDISSGVDKIWYTEEEKTEDQMKMTTQAMEAWLRMVEMMKSSEQLRSITRRIISLFVILNLFCLIWICVAFEIANSMGWLNLSKVILEDGIAKGVAFTPVTWAILKIAGAFELGWVFCTIIIFYFGPQLAQVLTSKSK